MKEIFTKLLNHRTSKSFEEAILPSQWAHEALGHAFKETNQLDQNTIVLKEPIEVATVPLEKVELIESLESFVSKKIETQEKPELQIGDSVFKIKGETKCLSLGKSEKPITEKSLKVLFLNDYFRGEFGGLKEESFQLLEKMAKAMGLEQEEYRVKSYFQAKDKASLDTIKEESHQNLIDLIAETRPSFIITVGVMSAQHVLEKKDRLTKLRGKLFARSIEAQEETHSFQVLPIFHPDFLLINPSMKATTWNDLKLAIEQF